MSSARNAGESAICPVRAQPSAEIVRVECAKRRRECDLSGPRATLCGDRACRAREMQARVRFAGRARNPLRRSCVSSARAGESAMRRVPARPSAEIVRVECAKCRRACDLPAARANPLRRSCVSSARNAGESAICRLPAQPSAEIARVECAKCRRECDLPAARATLCGECVSSARNAGESAIWYATLVRRVAGELEAENWRRGSARVVRGVAGEREDENWRVGSTT